MKPFASIGLFILIGLLTALVTGFRTDMLFTQPAYDEEQEGLNERIIIKFSHVVAENTPKGLAVEKFSQLVKEKTQGRVEVQVFPNAILYSDDTEQQALMRGDIQMIAPAFSKLATVIPEWLAMDLPYAFQNEKDVEQAFRGSIGRMLFETLEPHNMKGLAFWSNGFKQITSNEPILHPQDFAGHRLRIMSSSKVLAAQFRNLRAEAVDIPFNLVYQKLESGEVDGQENTISNIFTKRLYQVQKHLTLSNHGYLGYGVIVNKAFWDRLPPDIQANLTEAMREATLYNNKLAIWMNEQQLKQIKQISSLQIHELSPEERDVWRQAMQPVYKQFTPIIGGELVGEIQKLQEIR